MLSINDIKVGSLILFREDPCKVTFCQHSKTGRAGAVLRTKLENLKTGAIVNHVFQGSDKFQEPDIEKKKAQYLYDDEKNFYFMDEKTYEQFSIAKEIIEKKKNFLKESLVVDVLYFNQSPVSIDLPIKMDFEVIEAPPAVKGNTADGGSKQVTLENDIKIFTPLFVKQGDVVRINTQTGEYVERV